MLRTLDVFPVVVYGIIEGQIPQLGLLSTDSTHNCLIYTKGQFFLIDIGYTELFLFLICAEEMCTLSPKPTLSGWSLSSMYLERIGVDVLTSQVSNTFIWGRTPRRTILSNCRFPVQLWSTSLTLERSPHPTLYNFTNCVSCPLRQTSQE